MVLTVKWENYYVAFLKLIDNVFLTDFVSRCLICLTSHLLNSKLATDGTCFRATKRLTKEIWDKIVSFHSGVSWGFLLTPSKPAFLLSAKHIFQIFSNFSKSSLICCWQGFLCLIQFKHLSKYLPLKHGTDVLLWVGKYLRELLVKHNTGLCASQWGKMGNSNQIGGFCRDWCKEREREGDWETVGRWAEPKWETVRVDSYEKPCQLCQDTGCRPLVVSIEFSPVSGSPHSQTTYSEGCFFFASTSLP